MLEKEDGKIYLYLTNIIVIFYRNEALVAVKIYYKWIINEMLTDFVKMPLCGKERWEFDGRGDRIRTCDLFVPNEARYQTAPHPDKRSAHHTLFYP